MLHVAARISVGERECDQGVARVGCKGEVARLVGGVEGASHPLEAGAHMSCPHIDELPEIQVDAGLEAVQSPFLHQIKDELAKAVNAPPVAEMGAPNHAEI